MQEKNNRNSNSLGIFRKLFNFSDKLFGRGVKRMTGGQHVSLCPARPSGEMMMVHFQDQENSKDDLVPFKGFEGPVDKFSSQPQMHKAADRITDQVRSSRDKAMEKGKKVSEQPPGRKREIPPVQQTTINGKKISEQPPSRKKEVPLVQETMEKGKKVSEQPPGRRKEVPLVQATMEKGKKVSEQPPGRKKEVPTVQEKIVQPQLQGKSFNSSTAAVPSRVPKKMVGVKESEEKDRNKNKGKNTPSDQNLTFAIQDEEVKMASRISSPLPGLAPNIDKKSEAFIKRKKEAMTRNLSMDIKPS